MYHKMKVINAIRGWLQDTARVMRREFKMMIHDQGLMLFFVALPLMYPVVYTLIYNPEVVRDIKVAVVDDSRTPESRNLVQKASAAPAIGIYGYATDMEEAREWWAEQKVFAILLIPNDFGEKYNSGEQSHATMYCDMSLLLRYRALMAACSGLQMEITNEITQQRVEAVGAQSLGMTELPVQSSAHFLGDPTQGFASFIMIGIVLLILQQSLILGAGLLGATSRERRRANGGHDPLEIQGVSPFATVWGKAFAYALFYIPASIYVLHFIPWMFDLPHIGNPAFYLLFVFPMLLASGFLGQIAVIMLREREYVFPVIVFTSLVFLFLSGLTWPRFAMSPGWCVVGNLIPSTWGIEGFVRINSNGGTIAQNVLPYCALWIQVALYSILAAVIYMRLKRIALRTSGARA